MGPMWGLLLPVFLLGAPGGGWVSFQQDKGYVGSKLCVSCHPEVARKWQSSAHALTARFCNSGDSSEIPSAGADPAGGGHRPLEIGRRESEAVQVRTDFQISLPEGSQLKVRFPPHDRVSTEASLDAGRKCFGCHTTGYYTSDRTYVEPGVGCEACHGPGWEHVESAGSGGSIVNPGSLTADLNRMVCGQCHSSGTDPSGVHPFPVLAGGAPFRPGTNLASSFVDSRPLVTLQAGEYSTFVNSPEPYSNQLCTDCHDPHGSPEAPSLLVDPTSALCKRCHGNPLSGVDQVSEESHWGADRHPCWHCHDYAHVH